MRTNRRRLVPALVFALAAALLASLASPAGAQSSPVTLRLGYFPNVTHGSAIVGVEKGFFKSALGANKLKVTSFNAGPTAIQALLAGAIDATYVGPSPAINGWAQSKALKIVSGSASGGALLVVRDDINDVDGLIGKKVATPQLGNTQDVAARYYFKTQGIKTDTSGGGQISIVPQDNAQTLNAFKTRSIAGAWVPEPWASRIVLETNKQAHVILDERQLWPKRQFVTTHLVVSAKFLKDHPDVVKQLLQGQIKANDYIRTNPAESKVAVDAGITRLTGAGISAKLLDAVWKNLDFTNDPIASTLQPNAQHAQAVGLLKDVDLKGIYDLRILNSLLKAAGKPQVSSAGL
ncbi:MAG: hypothetical protein JWO68_3310 [Actinomycetia bacterium]|nr:hypothetical protein [Actinomycetes bacterium]